MGMMNAGIPLEEVQRVTGIAPRRVKQWAARLAETGHVEDAPRSGRPRHASSAALAPALAAVVASGDKARRSARAVTAAERVTC